MTKDNAITFKKDRSDYYKQWYKEHKEERKARYEQEIIYYKASDVRRLVRQLKPIIGKVNADIILNSLKELESGETNDGQHKSDS